MSVSAYSFVVLISMLTISTSFYSGETRFQMHAFARLREKMISSPTIESNVRMIKSGLHGEDFRFLPVTQGSPDDHFPRILQIAGVGRVAMCANCVLSRGMLTYP